MNALLHHVNDLSGIGGELRPGIVHRLDKGTSGVMVVAKNDAAHQELARQFHDREVEKEYVALVWGLVQKRKRIDLPIGRDPVHREKISTRARRARSAVTRVTWARQLPGVTLMRVAIATGRTHQIRVHLSAIGHPIVGDALYGGVHKRVPHDVRAVQRLDAARSCTPSGWPSPTRAPASACRSRRRCPTTCSGARRHHAGRQRAERARGAQPCPRRRPPTTIVHERREVYRGRVFTLSVDRVTLPSGHTSVMDVVRHPGLGGAAADAGAGRAHPDSPVPLHDRSVDLGAAGRQPQAGRGSATRGARASAKKRSGWCRAASSGWARFFPRRDSATRR